MKFALINGEKTEPIKGAKGLCPNCRSEMIAKCGQFKINHWAHKGIRVCDSWWENETKWHREWKNNFPIEWQEITLYDENTNEKHIADVQTTNGLVVEFQHSHIDPNERITREKFYKNMVWIVDGTRLKRDYSRFLKGYKTDSIIISEKGIFQIRFPEDYFPNSWLDSSVPVIFDFKGTNLLETDNIKNHLYCLFPFKNCRNAILAKFSHNAFVKSVNLDEWSIRIENYINKLNEEESIRQTLNTQKKIRRKESQYVLEKGRWKRRKRF